MSPAVLPARPGDATPFTVVALAGPLAGVAARALADELAGVAALAFAGPPWNESRGHARRRASRMLADAGNLTFTLAFTMADRGPVISGFAYGVTRQPGSAPGTAPTLPGTGPFEFCALAVRPPSRGQGAGRALHDAVLAASGPCQRWLATHPAAYPAAALFRASGWHAGRQFPSRDGPGCS